MEELSMRRKEPADKGTNTDDDMEEDLQDEVSDDASMDEDEDENDSDFLDKPDDLSSDDNEYSRS